MNKNFLKLLRGYESFRHKYVRGEKSIMERLAIGQNPKMMMVACSDSRVDPALLLQCQPGDIFVIRNVANIVPPYEADETHHGTSAALEYGVCYLNIKDLVILGHSQCGGIQGLLDHDSIKKTDFIKHWVKLAKLPKDANINHDDYAKLALQQSGENCLTFPWIKERVDKNELTVHLWFFDIKTGIIHSYNPHEDTYEPIQPEIE